MRLLLPYLHFIFCFFSSILRGGPEGPVGTAVWYGATQAGNGGHPDRAGPNQGPPGSDEAGGKGVRRTVFTSRVHPAAHHNGGFGGGLRNAADQAMLVIVFF